MEKSKKISFTSIAIVVLAILLTVSLSMGGTLAWFANQNSGGTILTMGNAVGVAQVASGGTANSDQLSFTFYTGANGELMLPGVQVDPDVNALIASSNTNTILRAVVTFEITVKSALRATLAADPYNYTIDNKGFMTVPASLTGIIGDDDPVVNELGILSMMYQSFFAKLQDSAEYNGWAYKQANDGTKSTSEYASTKYYMSNPVSQNNTPIVATRQSGPGLTQPTSGAHVAADSDVLYNAFYFTGWSEDTTVTAPAGNYANGDGIKYVRDGLDIYAQTYSDDSLVSTVFYASDRAYYYDRSTAYTGYEIATPPTQDEIIEGKYTIVGGVATRENVVDPLATYFSKSTATDTWRTGGVQSADEKMMCVLDTDGGKKLVPLFDHSFRLPTTWTQDAFADRSMRMNVTFQVMQSDYLASGQSHHVSVELAESRFDDVTVWATADQVTVENGLVAGQPYVKNAANFPDFNNPGYWGDAYINDITG